MKRILLTILGILVASAVTSFGQTGKATMYDSVTYRWLESKVVSSNRVAITGGDLFGNDTNSSAVVRLQGKSIPVPGAGDTGKAYVYNAGTGAFELQATGGTASNAIYATSAGFATNAFRASELVVTNAAGYTSFVAQASSGLANHNNTIAGSGAGVSLTSGVNNTIIGKGAGANLANGNYNTVMGNEAFYKSVASSINTVIGDWAMHEHTNGNYNTAIGAGAMKNVLIGSDNHVIGPNIMADGINVSGNIGIGYTPIRNIRYGGHNVAFGSEALRWVYSNAYDNVAIGRFSLWNLGQFDWTNCSRNVAVGPYAGHNLASGDGNIFLGYYALASGTSVSNEFVAGGVQQPIRNVWFGSGPNGTVPWTLHGEVATGLFNVVRANTVIVTNRLGAVTFMAPVCPNANGAGAGMTIAGTGAGVLVTNADNLTVYGATAGGGGVLSGVNNTLIGAQAGYSTTTGGRNTFVGQSAGYFNTVGQFNTFIGKDAGQNAVATTNVIAIGIDAGQTPGLADNIMLGRSSRASSSSGTNEFVAGSDSYPMRDVYFGGGPGSTKSWTLHGEYASGVFSGLYVNTDATGSNMVVNWRTMTNYVAGVTPAVPNLQGVTTVGNLTSNGMIVVTAGGKTSLVINAVSSAWAPAQGGVPETRPTSTLIGYNVGGSMTSAVNNTLIGYEAGRDMQGGEHNVMIGDRAGVFSTNADENVFIGQSAGYVNGDGWYNVYVGREAGENNSGSNNTAIGHHAGRNGVYPSANPAYHNMTILGDSAGETTPGLRDNILMGVLAQASGASATNEFVAGSPTSPMLDVYFGGGPGSAIPWTLHGEYASGLFLSLTENSVALSNKYAQLGTDNTYAGGSSQNLALGTITNNASASTDIVNWRTMTNYVLTAGFLKADGSVLWTGDQNAGGTIITNLGGFWMGGVLVTNLDTNAVTDLEIALTGVSNRVVTLEGQTNSYVQKLNGSATNLTVATLLNGPTATAIFYALSVTNGGSTILGLQGSASTNLFGSGSARSSLFAGGNYGTREVSGGAGGFSTLFGYNNAGAYQYVDGYGALISGHNNGRQDVRNSGATILGANWTAASTQEISSAGVLLGGYNNGGKQKIFTAGAGSILWSYLTSGQEAYLNGNGAMLVGGPGTNTHDYSMVFGNGQVSYETNSVSARKYFEGGVALASKYLQSDGSLIWTGNQDAGGTIITNLGGFWMGGVLVTNINTNAISGLAASILNVSNRVVTLEGQTNSYVQNLNGAATNLNVATLLSVAGNAEVGTVASQFIVGSGVGSLNLGDVSTSVQTQNNAYGSVNIGALSLGSLQNVDNGMGAENFGFLYSSSTQYVGGAGFHEGAGSFNGGYLRNGSLQANVGLGAFNYGYLTNAVQTNSGKGSFILGGAGTNTHDYAVLLGAGLTSSETNAVFARKYFENGVSLDAKYTTYPVSTNIAASVATNVVNGYIVGSGYMYMTENVGTSILYHVTMAGTHTNKIGEYYTP